MVSCWKNNCCRKFKENDAKHKVKKPGFFQRNPKIKMLWTKTKTSTYILSNGIFPLADVSSDYATFLYLLNADHGLWAACNLACMFLPFLLKLGMFLTDLARGQVTVNHLAGLILHLPFVAPIIHIILGLRLLVLDTTNPKQHSTIEQIEKLAAYGSMYESFLEAGPQLQLQLHIVQCTGRITTIQIASMCFSVLTLTLAASRAYFIQRGSKEADPSPNPHMILRVFPWMFILLVTSVLSWSIVLMLKEFVWVVLAISISVTWLTLHCKCTRKTQVEELELVAQNANTEEAVTGMKKKRNIDQTGKQVSNTETCSSMLICIGFFSCGFCFCGRYWSEFKEYFVEFADNLAHLLMEPVGTEQTRFFAIKAAMTSIWMPCIIGTDKKMLLKSALSSITIRTTALLIVLALYALHFPGSLQSRTTLLFCDTSNNLEKLNITDTCPHENEPCFSFASCSGNSTVDVKHCLKHRHRICGEGDSFFITHMSYLIIILHILSSLAIVKLSWMADYRKLYKASRNMPCFAPCFPLLPIVHRSVVFGYIEEGNADQLEEVLRGTTEDQRMRQNEEGLSAANAAIKRDTAACLEALIKIEVESLKNEGKNKRNADNLEEAETIQATEETKEIVKRIAKDSTESAPIQTAIKYKSVSCFKKLAQLEVDMPVVRIQVSCSGNLFTVNVTHAGDELEVPGLDLTTVAKLLKKENVTQELVIKGLAPVNIAAKEGKVDKLQELLDAGINPNTKDKGNWNALSTALKHSQYQIAMQLLDAGSRPMPWWEDAHCASPDGISFVVHIVMEDRLDILEAILRRSQEAHPNKNNLGVSHLVVGQSDLGDIMWTGDTANREAVSLLAKYGVTNIPVENYPGDKAVKMVARWMEEVGEYHWRWESITATHEELYNDLGHLVKSEAWSGRNAFQLQGKVTGFQVSVDNGRTKQLRLRHGNIWEPWRIISRGSTGKEQEEVILDPEESVVAIVSLHGMVWYGMVSALQFTTSTGQQYTYGDWDDAVGYTKTESVIKGARLAYCSGRVDRDGGGRIDGPGINLTFHWSK